MTFVLPPLILFSSAISYAHGTVSLRELARRCGMPVAALKEQFEGIRPKDVDSISEWLDAVPGRRAAFQAVGEAAKRDIQKFEAEFAPEFALDTKRMEDHLALDREKDQQLMDEFAAEDLKLDDLLRDLRCE